MGEHCAWCGDGERLKYGICTSVVEINTRKLPLFGNESICSLLSSSVSSYGQQEQGTQRTIFNNDCRVSSAIILQACRTSQYSPGVGVMTILETRWRLVTASSMLPGLKPTPGDILRL